MYKFFLKFVSKNHYAILKIIFHNKITMPFLNKNDTKQLAYTI